MHGTQTTHSLFSGTLAPRQLWYAPDRRLRRKSASAEAVNIVLWIRMGCDPDHEPDEASFFVALHTCAYRAARRNGSTRITEAERVKWAKRWQIIRDYLVGRNIGLAYTTLARFGSHSIDPDDMLSDALYALTRAVDRYNPWKGFQFSTYACNAIVRSLVHRVHQESKYRQIFHPQYDIAPDSAERLPDFQTEVYVERLRRVLDRNLCNLSNLESRILNQRFQAGPHAQPSLQKIGDTVGLSKERVRQIQNGAIRKLRMAMNNDPLLQ